MNVILLILFKSKKTNNVKTNNSTNITEIPTHKRTYSYKNQISKNTDFNNDDLPDIGCIQAMPQRLKYSTHRSITMRNTNRNVSC